MQLLDDHLFQLYCAGKISEEEAVDHSQSPGELQDKMEQLKNGQIAAPTQPDAQQPDGKGDDDVPANQLRK